MRNVILAFSALLLTSASFAQPGAGGPPPGAAGGMPDNATIFANNDANEDGEITRAEADAAGLPLSQNWDAFDLDGDGKVVAAELDQARGRIGGAGRAGGPGGRGGPAAAAPADADADADGDDEDEDEDEDEGEDGDGDGDG